MHSGRTDGNHPGGWEILTWCKKRNVFYHEGKKNWNREKLQNSTEQDLELAPTWAKGWTQICGSTPEPSDRVGKPPEFGTISNKKLIFQLEGLNLVFSWFHTRDLTFTGNVIIRWKQWSWEGEGHIFVSWNEFLMSSLSCSVPMCRQSYCRVLTPLFSALKAVNKWWVHWWRHSPINQQQLFVFFS